MLFHGYQLLLVAFTIIIVMVIVAWRDTILEQRYINNNNKNLNDKKKIILKSHTLLKETIVPFFYHLFFNILIGFDFFIIKPILVLYFICSLMFGLFIVIQKRYFLQIIEVLNDF